MNKLTEAPLDRTSATCKRMIKEMTTEYGMTRKQARAMIKTTTPEVLFINELYVVSVFKNEPHNFGPDVDVWHLSIRRQDRAAVHDWRHFQQIKNEICGKEYEGLELYPAESRVLDAANQYHLYVIMQDGAQVPVGYGSGGRDDRNIGKAKQRPFEKGL